MHSRTILLGGILGLACLVLVGAAAMHVMADAESVSNRDAVEASGTPSVVEVDEATAPTRRAVADTLGDLFDQIKRADASDSLRITAETVPLFAEMIHVIDEHADFDIRIIVARPSEIATRRDVEALRNALLLNVRHPDRLHISAVNGARAVTFEVRDRRPVR